MLHFPNKTCQRTKTKELLACACCAGLGVISLSDSQTKILDGGGRKEAEGGGKEKVGGGRGKIGREGGKGASGRRRSRRPTKEEEGERQRGERSNDDRLIAEFTPSQTNLRRGERKKGQEGEEGAAGRKSGGSGLEEEGKRKAEKRAER